MADDADRADELIELERAASIKRAARALAIGAPGECWACGCYSLRLINRACAPCREEAERVRRLRAQIVD